MMCRLTVTHMVFLSTVSVSNALFVAWEKDANLTSDDIFIKLKNAYIPRRFGRITQEFRNLTSHSLDERCQKGMGLSISWSLNLPYAGILGPKFGKKSGFAARGIFPNVINRIVQHCCNGSKIKYGAFVKSIWEAEDFFSEQKYDFTFPVYIAKVDKDSYRDQPFVPVVTAPRVMLLVSEKGTKKTKNFASTIFDTWPFLVFILAAAGASGMMVWLLEFVFFSNEFSKRFVNGAWDGFWWAVVTMTTVGYGDSSPKSLPGRLFCFIWIITGINIISIFTALVTASVTATTRPYFNIHGAKIGAVNGSEEFRLGVSINFDMQAFSTPVAMTKAVQDFEIDGLLIDNYALTRFSQFLEKGQGLRVERTIEHPITYGLVLPSGAPQTTQCVRRYMRNYNHEIFDHIAKYLIPIKTKQTDKNLAVEATEALFYQQTTFVKIVRNGVIIVGSLVIIGLLWELYRRYKQELLCGFPCRRIKHGKSKSGTLVPNDAKQQMIALQSKSESKKVNAEELVLGFNKFHKHWVEQLESVRSRKP